MMMKYSSICTRDLYMNVHILSFCLTFTFKNENSIDFILFIITVAIGISSKSVVFFSRKEDHLFVVDHIFEQHL